MSAALAQSNSSTSSVATMQSTGLTTNNSNAAGTGGVATAIPTAATTSSSGLAASCETVSPAPATEAIGMPSEQTVNSAAPTILSMTTILILLSPF